MANVTLTVLQYLARARGPFAPTDTVTITDSVEILNGLSAEQIGWMQEDNVDFLMSTNASATNPFVIDVAKFRAMDTTLHLGSGDNVKLVDTAAVISSLDIFEFERLTEGIDMIDASDNGTVTISVAGAEALLSSSLRMAADDNVTVADSLGNLQALINDATKLAALIDRNVDVFGVRGAAPVNINLASAIVLAGSVSASLDTRLIATVTNADFSSLSASNIRQLGLKNMDYLSSGSSQLILRADQAAALAETASLSCIPSSDRPSNDVLVIVRDTAANLATLSPQHIASLDAKNVDFLESSDENGALALTAAQFSALVAATRLAVKPATVATLSDTAAAISAALAALADLTPDQRQRVSFKGIDAIDATDGGSIELSVETLRNIGWSFAANDTVVLKVAPDALDGFSGTELEMLAGRGVDVIASTTGALTLNLQRFNLLGTVGFLADDTVTVTVNATEDGIAALSTQDIAAMDDRAVDYLGASGSLAVDLVLRVEQAGALADTLFLAANADDTVTVRDTAAHLATLSAQQITSLDAKNVDLLDLLASEEALALSAAQVAALAATARLAVSQTGTTTLADTGANITNALAALTAEQVGMLSAKGIDAIDATGAGAIGLSLAKLNGLGWVTLAADDIITLRDTGAAFSALTAAQIAALSGRRVDALDAVDNRVAWSLAQFKALGGLRLAADDSFDIRGTASADSVLGKANKELILGLAGNDRLNGGAGNDTLSGGSGKDILTGGSGSDRFRFDAALNARTNLDTVTDWRNGDDKFLLDDAVFKKIGAGTAAGRTLSAKFFAFGPRKDKDDYLAYDSRTGKVSYDADGIGTKYKPIDFLQLQKGLSAKTLNAGDFLIV
ncbi:calcium-binding protein [Microvirga sp. M2]|uniref:calcium-binding protein n=1 Tax=Microvirga sp. M2 TaxID=3073270 RepID=UPI0039C49829